MENCPVCKESLEPAKYGIDYWHEGEGATLDCYHCNAILLIRNGIPVDFHKTLHEEDSRWPENGNGTAYVELEDES
jgi:uncharacterized protein YbaR (Trm112 family)